MIHKFKKKKISNSKKRERQKKRNIGKNKLPSQYRKAKPHDLLQLLLPTTSNNDSKLLEY